VIDFQNIRLDCPYDWYYREGDEECENCCEKDTCKILRSFEE